MTQHVVDQADNFEDGERRVVEIDGRHIGVFRLENDYYAYLNWCPHQAGPVCEGAIIGQQLESFDREQLEKGLEWSSEEPILVCPWHSWEFDLRTGENLPDRSVKLPSFPIRVEDGNVIVEL